MVAVAYALPQLLYRRTSAHWLVGLAPLLRGIAWIARPCVALLEFFQSLVDFADTDASQNEEPSTEENIEALISAGAEEGLIEEEDRKLIQSVVEFGDKVVREVMTPRPNIVAIAADATLEALRRLVIHEQYSRIPVYEQNIDQVIGFVHVRDMFELEDDQRASRTVRELARPIPFVPETKPVNDLMRQMQQENTHMVIVVDEYGNTAGLATMEDLLEVIIGEIRDEHEPATDVTDDGHGGFIVSGSFDLARVRRSVRVLPPRGRHRIHHHRRPGERMAGPCAQTRRIRGSRRHSGQVLASDELRVEQVRIAKSETVAQ